MNLKVSKEKAIEIFNKRLSESKVTNLNVEAWKEKVLHDCQQIFGAASSPWFSISKLQYFDFDGKVNIKALLTARKLIEGFISQINDYVIDKSGPLYQPVGQRKQLDYEAKYDELLTEWNDLVTKHNELLKDFEAKDDEVMGNEALLLEKEIEIKELQENTLQIGNITLGKLFNALSLGQIVAIITTAAALIGVGYTMGAIVESTKANNESFELRTDNVRVNQMLKQKNVTIDSLRTVNNNLQQVARDAAQQLQHVKKSSSK
jgi:hypothetical protein